MHVEIREDVLNPASIRPGTYAVGRLDTRSACDLGRGHPLFETGHCPKRARDGWCFLRGGECDVFPVEEVVQ